MKECLSCLKSMHADNSRARSEKQKRDSLKFICQMMSTFFEGTEESGIGKLRMHRQLEYGEFLQKIVVETKMPFRRGKDANFIEISTYANMTVWELKSIIAKHTNSSPLCITLKRTDSKKPEIKDFRNCKLLSDLKFTDHETVSVMRARAPDVAKVPLIDKDGKVVEELRAIIASWFETYSVELTKDEIIEISKRGAQPDSLTPEYIASLPDKARAMTRETCAQFAEAITTLQEIDVDDYRVTTLFDKYSRRLGCGHLIVEEELLNFYQEKASNTDEVVRQNLHHQGIANDLKPRIDVDGLTSETDERIVKDETTLPRAKLASNHELFAQLLQLVESSHGDEAEGIWDLLMNLQTNS